MAMYSKKKTLLLSVVWRDATTMPLPFYHMFGTINSNKEDQTSFVCCCLIHLYISVSKMFDSAAAFALSLGWHYRENFPFNLRRVLR
mmetsp:Transcript_31189/g.51748  ORF Transcript_31189/g.51748 Transcript_31189/m.51748 type:complete len:87 (-) Transcript_31189:198-458(-)